MSSSLAYEKFSLLTKSVSDIIILQEDIVTGFQSKKDLLIDDDTS